MAYRCTYVIALLITVQGFLLDWSRPVGKKKSWYCFTVVVYVCVQSYERNRADSSQLVFM